MIRHVTCEYVMQASIEIFVIHIYIIYIYMERKIHIIYAYKINKMNSNDSILHVVFLHCHVNRESSALHWSAGARLLGFPDGIVT